jgi:orotate phosphoribosyltransferase
VPDAIDLTRLVPSRKGHFVLESGHHGSLWLDMERLCLRVEPVRQLARELAGLLRDDRIEVVCGPLVDGAFIALLTAGELDVPFTYAERIGPAGDPGLYAWRDRIPDALRAVVHGRRVAIVNDVVNAGSAVRGTFVDLKSCGADVVALGALAVLGEWGSRFAAGERLHLAALEAFANQIWVPEECPLCAAGEPLVNPLGAMGGR